MTADKPAQPPENIPLLTVSLVVYQPDLAVFKATLRSLSTAVQKLGAADTKVFIVQNCKTEAVPDLTAAVLQDIPFEILEGHGNIGFGRGHNLVLADTGQIHLVLNPDIEMAEDALVQAVDFFKKHDDCGLLTPQACWPDGTRQFLCKRYPALFDLLLRGFAPEFLKKLFGNRLARYEMSAETGLETFWAPPIVSGCFMVFRGDVYRKLGGFDPRFFLYFEDFDLALRAGKITRIAYVPSIRVIHEGGHAARKGFGHIKLFARSAFQFYQLHGLKVF
ncbi:glycosyltransferase [Labrenzia sp. PHM005]|uniref:glycosyltransferase n=1 Tax=Labrenzia sp. PHM005 TaxID=2590016 RepID=UPI00114061F6|nr:glycosyltransferase [Labrenzia sp. PHM005]QDG74949.1 glycosyltransferase [Labrenzia sp. PHM005]